MQPNRLIYGAWGLLLLGAAIIAIANSQSEPELTEAPSQSSSAAEETTTTPASPQLPVTPAAFSQDSAPRRLPVVSEADPLADTKLKELRRIVAEEMPGASETELDVWTEEFADMPEDAVRLMLQQRRQLRGLPSAQSAPVPLPRDVDGPGIATTSIDASVIEKAKSILLRNCANTNTAGYRRRVIEFSGTSAANALNIAEVRFDMTHVNPTYTGRATDLAVASGFFSVEDGKSTYFTKTGRFSIGDDRRLVLRIGERQLKLAGVKPLPELCDELKIQTNGVVAASTGGESTVLGQVRVATFIDSSRLGSDDGCLFVATPASGSPHYPPSPEVKQGWLEPSNVDVSAERRLLDALPERVQ